MKTRNEYPKLLNDLNLKKGLELGVFKGGFSKVILENWNGILYMVDVWRGLGYDEYDDSSNHNNHITAYSDSMNSILGYEDRAFMLRMKGEYAAEFFPDESLDFIYIDANHSYEGVKADLELWYPKIRKGGLFSGHDYLDIDWWNDPHFAPNGKDKYIWSRANENEELKYAGVFGVNPAVDEFCERHNQTINLTDEWAGTWWFIKK